MGVGKVERDGFPIAVPDKVGAYRVAVESGWGDCQGERSPVRLRVVRTSEGLPGEWDRFVVHNPGASLYHLGAWRDVIGRAYGKESLYLIAETSEPDSVAHSQKAVGDGGRPRDGCQNRILGVLPLFCMGMWFSGRSLVSIPYFDGGGILTDSEAVASQLVTRSAQLASDFGATVVDFRQLRAWVGEGADGDVSHILSESVGWEWHVAERSKDRVRMILDLPQDPSLLWRGFRAKLRSQIQRPIKEGLRAVVGGVELLDDFYSVFSENMRDLGSPVHAKAMIREALLAFPAAARVFVVYGNRLPVAGSLAIGFRDALVNPWASSLRRYRAAAPNMLLYWRMLEFGCLNGYKEFDFGRSRAGEGTYKFKEQWGARPEPLNWRRVTSGNPKGWGLERDSAGMSRAVEIWKRLPLSVTRFLGPRIRRHISL